MTEPYLILHKVRGAPAFDIAIQIQIGDEEGWIIPTSGHRAYPYYNVSLNDLRLDPIEYGYFKSIGSIIPRMPDDYEPDHYSCNSKPAQRPTLFTGLLEQLGMVKKVERRF